MITKKEVWGMFELLWILGMIVGLLLLIRHIVPFRIGPARCVGCGKCDHNGGICILTGKPLALEKSVAVEKSSPLTNGENGI